MTSNLVRANSGGMITSGGGTTATTTTSGNNGNSNGVDVLMLGLQGSGKSFLIKQMKNIITNSELSVFYDGLPTNGVNLEELVIGLGKKKAKRIKIREVGGGIILTWHRYFEECKVIVFVIDASNSMQLSSSCIELLNLLSKLKDQKQFIVILNKRDAPCIFSSQLFEHFIQFSHIKESCKHLELIELSAQSGENIQQLIDSLHNLI